MDTDPPFDDEKEAEAIIEEYGRLVARVEGQRPFLEEMIASLDKWLLATLIAVNGGAVLALLAALDHVGFDIRIPSALFLLGIVAALLSGLLRRAADVSHFSRVIQTREVYEQWLKSVQQTPTGSKYFIASGSTWEPRHTISSKFPRQYAVSSVLLWLSLVLFISGAAVTGASLDSPAPAQSKISDKNIPKK